MLCRVSGFWKALSSIRSRLDACVTAESDSQLLIAEADAKLRGCELWLLENGKFSDNQFIMQQKENYEVGGERNFCLFNFTLFYFCFFFFFASCSSLPNWQRLTV